MKWNHSKNLGASNTHSGLPHELFLERSNPLVGITHIILLLEKIMLVPSQTSLFLKIYSYVVFMQSGMQRTRDDLEKKLHDSNTTPMFFPLEFLKAITCDFSTESVLGEGGFGVVYKVWAIL